MKTEYLWADMVLFGDECNLRCDYCFGFNRFLGIKKSEKAKKERKPPIAPDIQIDSAIATLDKIRDYASFPICKVSGGEIFLHDEIDRILEYAQQSFHILQILTNGLNIGGERIERFAEQGNVLMQVSLDGATPESNVARTDKSAIHGKIWGHVQQIIRSGMPLEINCIMTRSNVKSLPDFVKALADESDRGGPVTFVPRPVRGTPHLHMGPQADDVAFFENEMLGLYDQYAEVLPPRNYFLRVIKMMKSGRTRRCYIPYFVLGLQAMGEVRSCTVGGMPVAGNLMQSDDVGSTVHDRRHYDGDIGYSPCNDCINQYEMLNMLVEQVVTMDELKAMATYSDPLVLNTAERIAAWCRKKYSLDRKINMPAAQEVLG